MIKNKIIKHLIKNGKKETGERLLDTSLKKIQKKSTKPLKKILQLSILNSMPIFKLHKISNKKLKKKKNKVKEIPAFISKNTTRISLALKFFLYNLKKKSKKSSIKLSKEIMLSFMDQGTTIHHKNELQKRVLLNKRYLRFYRW